MSETSLSRQSIALVLTTKLTTTKRIYTVASPGFQSINQSINQFISRHSTEARATVRLCRFIEKCLETDLKCVNGWSSSTAQWKRVPKSHCCEEGQSWKLGHGKLTVDFRAYLDSWLSCVVCEISWCRCQQLAPLSISDALVTKLLVIKQLLHPARKSTVSFL